jgi:hypothetical protein
MNSKKLAVQSILKDLRAARWSVLPLGRDLLTGSVIVEYWVLIETDTCVIVWLNVRVSVTAVVRVNSMVLSSVLSGPETVVVLSTVRSGPVIETVGPGICCVWVTEM